MPTFGKGVVFDVDSKVRAEQFRFFASALQTSKLKSYVPLFVKETEVCSMCASCMSSAWNCCRALLACFSTTPEQAHCNSHVQCMTSQLNLNCILVAAISLTFLNGVVTSLCMLHLSHALPAVSIFLQIACDSGVECAGLLCHLA